MLEQWFWDRYAACYDTVNRLVPYRRMLDDLIDALDITPGMRLLNAGCGTGNLERRLAERGIGCRITSIDFSDVMLRRAQRKCRNLPITFLKADLTDRLPFPDESFDRIVSTNVLYTLPSPKNTLQELSRLLAPNGRMAHSTPIHGFRMIPIVQSHWRLACCAEKFDLALFLPSFTALTLFNLALVRREQKGQYTFLTRQEAEECVRQNDLQGQLNTTYATQDWLLVMERSRHAVTV